MEFVSRLRHTKGEWAGQPFRLQKWQTQFIRELFGRVRPKDKLRQYRSAYLEVPRKNGKTELAAALALLLLVGDDGPGAEVYSAAADRDQASLVFNAAATMVRSDPILRQHLRILDSSKRIVCYKTNGFYHAISAEAYSKHGFNAHAVIYDELHVARNRELWDVLQTSMGARRQPLMLAITTAGHDKNSICWEQHDYAEKILNGVIQDKTFLPIIYAADTDADWTDEAVWRKANPNLGVSVKLDFLRQECKKAQEIPAYQNTFRRLYLNQWTTQETRWLDMKTWDACDGEPVIPDGSPCYLGLDLSSTTDITSASLFCPETGAVLNWSWIPAENMVAREHRDKGPFAQWEREGWVTPTPGNAIDYAFIRKKVNDLKVEYPSLQIVGYDPWNAMQLAIQLEQEDGVPVIPIRQGYQTLSPACKELERRVLEGTLQHGGNPVLRWATDNVVIQADPNDNIRPVKNKATERIDPTVSLIIAIAAWQQTEDPQESVYETRGVIAL